MVQVGAVESEPMDLKQDAAVGSKKLKVDGRPISLKARHSVSGLEVGVKMSPEASVGELKRKICDDLGEDETVVTLWTLDGGQKGTELVRAEETLSGADLEDHQRLLLEVSSCPPVILLPDARSGDRWARQEGSNDSSSNASDSMDHVALSPIVGTSLSAPAPATSARLGSSSSSSSLFSDSATKGSTSGAGLAGLRNLGNTCFMNSALQCLGHTRPVVEYFLGGKCGADLNRDNPLGLKGELALAFEALLGLLWGEGNTSVVPRGFKHKLSEFAPQFGGYSQHDSHELTAFLLDGLHEDLNRVKNKAYIEEKDADGRPDEELAKEAWQNYRRRNDSMIVDHFQGLYKSTLFCPKCQKISKKFDPFMYLSVPLPAVHAKTINVLVFRTASRPAGGSEAHLSMVPVEVASTARAQDLAAELGKKLGLAGGAEGIDLAETLSGYIHRELDSWEKVEKISDGDEMVAYCDEPSAGEGGSADGGGQASAPEGKKVYVYHRQMQGELWTPFGVPLRFLYDAERDGAVDTFVERRISEALASLGLVEPQSMDVDDLYKITVTSNYGIGNTPLSALDAEKAAKDPQLHFGLDWSAKSKSVVDLQKFEYSSYPCRKASQPQATLMSCIGKFLSKEQLEEDDMWHCPSCKTFVQAHKKLDLWTLPNVLVVHLKRFSYRAHTFSRFYSRGDKVSTPVDFPFADLDLSEFVIGKGDQDCRYRLYAVSNHYGGLGGGHYTAHVKHPRDGKWYYFNDDSVSAAKEQDIDQSSAYLLFYEREGASVPMNGHAKAS